MEHSLLQFFASGPCGLAPLQPALILAWRFLELGGCVKW
jgi:hypothetical protein